MKKINMICDWFIEKKIPCNKLILGILLGILAILAILGSLILNSYSIDNSKDKNTKTEIKSEVDMSEGKTISSTSRDSHQINAKTVGNVNYGTINITKKEENKEEEIELFHINIKGKVIDKETKDEINNAIIYLPDYKEIDREYSNPHGDFKIISEKSDKENYIRITIEHSDYKTEKINRKIDNKNIYVEMIKKD